MAPAREETVTAKDSLVVINLNIEVSGEKVGYTRSRKYFSRHPLISMDRANLKLSMKSTT